MCRPQMQPPTALVLLLLTLAAATTPRWYTSMPPYVDFDEMELWLMTCIRTCLIRGCAIVVHQDLKCSLVPGVGSPGPSAALLLLREHPSNIALGKPARMSSVSAYNPKDTTDGYTVLEARTESEDFPFLVVDLGAQYDIEGVELWMNSDYSCVVRCDVRLGLEDLPGPDFSSFTLLLNMTNPDFSDYKNKKGFFPELRRGRFVAVQEMGTNEKLYVRELKVYGREI